MKKGQRPEIQDDIFGLLWPNDDKLCFSVAAADFEGGGKNKKGVVSDLISFEIRTLEGIILVFIANLSLNISSAMQHLPFISCSHGLFNKEASSAKLGMHYVL